VSRTTMTAALALMLAAAVPAYAQTSSSSTSLPSTSASSASNSATHVTATQLQPGQIRATQMDGATVYDTQNQKVGDVKDIILDRDGKVAAVVLDVGAFLGIGARQQQQQAALHGRYDKGPAEGGAGLRSQRQRSQHEQRQHDGAGEPLEHWVEHRAHDTGHAAEAISNEE